MRKLTIHDPVLISQSTTEPILWGAYQFPLVRRGEKGELYVRFSAIRDSRETYGQEDANPIYRSLDGGETWALYRHEEAWIEASPALPNGDHIQFAWHPIIRDLPPLPPVDDNRRRCKAVKDSGGAVYTVDELLPVLGDRVAKNFKARRIKAGTHEIVEELCPVRWDKMPATLHGDYVNRVFPTNEWRADKNGVLWMPVATCAYVAPDGTLGSAYMCTHLLRSDDMGHSWDYVSTIVYDDTYHTPDTAEVEGFNESALEILDDGSFLMFIRSGSLTPFRTDGVPYPIPKLYIARSYDQGKTWASVEPFADYGIRPYTIRLGCGTYMLTTGRPGVCIYTCDDPTGKEWSDRIPILAVPEEDKYKAYFEYSCSNNGLCAYDDHTAFISYSDFRHTAPNGERAKSIFIRKITVE